MINKGFSTVVAPRSKRLKEDKYKRDELMDALQMVLKDGGTLQAVKSALVDSCDPVAKTIARDLEERVQSSKPGDIKKDVACS